MKVFHLRRCAGRIRLFLGLFITSHSNKGNLKQEIPHRTTNRLEGKKVPRRWCRGSRARERGDAQTFEHEAKYGFMVVECCRLIRDLRKPWTDQDYRDSTPAVCVISG